MKKFIAELASKAPTPGGGSAGCVVGAIGVAAAKMVLNLTRGKKKYLQFEQSNFEAWQELECLAKEFLLLKDKDEQVFELVSRAYALPKGDKKSQELQTALKTAMQPPYSALEISLRSLEIVQGLLKTTNSNLISDLAVAAVSLEAAAKSCYFNVMINIKYIKDEEFCNFWTQKANACYKDALGISQTVQAKILQKII